MLKCDYNKVVLIVRSGKKTEGAVISLTGFFLDNNLTNNVSSTNKV